MALPGPTSVVTTESRRSYTACIPASASQLQQPVHWIGECVGLFEVGTGKAGDVLALAGCTSSSPSRSDSREPRPQEVVYLVYFILGRVSPRTLTRSTRRLDLWLGFACTACSQVSRATWVFRLQIAQPLAAVPTASGGFRLPASRSLRYILCAGHSLAAAIWGHFPAKLAALHLFVIGNGLILYTAPWSHRCEQWVRRRSFVSMHSLA